MFCPRCGKEVGDEDIITWDKIAVCSLWSVPQIITGVPWLRSSIPLLRMGKCKYPNEI